MTLERVSDMKEHKLLLPSSENLNAMHWECIRDKFFLNKETQESLAYLQDNPQHQAICKKFKLNDQLRAWYKMPLNGENDPGYSNYLTLLRDMVLNDELTRPEYYELGMRDYETYKSGKIVDGKQTYKLFKWLTKKGADPSRVEAVTTARTKARDLYLCISRNPVDWLFCSTNQSFTSCLSLTSDYREAYYMGLGGLSLDTNRLMVFVTKGLIKRYTVKNCEFKHFGYLSRAWAIWTASGRLKVETCYPQDNYGMRDLLDKVPGIRTVTNFKQGNHDFNMPLNENNSPQFIYLDCTGIEYHENRYKYTSYGSGSGHWCAQYNWTQGFECLDDIDEADNNCECYECGETVNEEHPHRVDGVNYCEDCFNEIFRYCHDCSETTSADNCYYIDGIGDICSTCYSNTYYQCDECRCDVYQDDAYSVQGESTLCQECYESLAIECTQCSDIFFKSDMYEVNGAFYCHDCYVTERAMEG